MPHKEVYTRVDTMVFRGTYWIGTAANQQSAEFFANHLNAREAWLMDALDECAVTKAQVSILHDAMMSIMRTCAANKTVDGRLIADALADALARSLQMGD